MAKSKDDTPCSIIKVKHDFAGIMKGNTYNA